MADREALPPQPLEEDLDPRQRVLDAQGFPAHRVYGRVLAKQHPKAVAKLAIDAPTLEASEPASRILLNNELPFDEPQEATEGEPSMGYESRQVWLAALREASAVRDAHASGIDVRIIRRARGLPSPAGEDEQAS